MASVSDSVKNSQSSLKRDLLSGVGSSVKDVISRLKRDVGLRPELQIATGKNQGAVKARKS